MSLSQGGILAIAVLIALVVALGSAAVGLISDRRVRANRLNRIRTELSRDTMAFPGTREGPKTSDRPSRHDSVPIELTAEPEPAPEPESSPPPKPTPQPEPTLEPAPPPAHEEAVVAAGATPGIARVDQRLLELRPARGELLVDSQDRAELSQLRANIVRLGGERPIHIAAVISPDASVKSAATAVALAFSEGPSGRVLLVECVSRHRTLGAWIGIPHAPGLIDFLAGDAKPQEVVGSVRVAASPSTADDAASPSQADQADASQLAYIVAGAEPRASELLGDQGFRSFLNEVSQVYDTVVLDCGDPQTDGSSPAIEAADIVVECVHTSAAMDDAETLAMMPNYSHSGQGGLLLFSASRV